jgi:hypothetical protein
MPPLTGLTVALNPRLARILHKSLEQAGGGSVSKLEKTDAYANNFHRPQFDRL